MPFCVIMHSSVSNNVTRADVSALTRAETSEEDAEDTGSKAGI